MKLSVVMILIQSGVCQTARCTTSTECYCKIDRRDSANRDVQVMVPWPAEECNMCQLLAIDSECEQETSMHSETFQFGFWVPYDSKIDRNTVAVIKIKNPDQDVKNPQFYIRGFNTPEMQGCGRTSFPPANSSALDKQMWARDTNTTTWSWNNQYVYNVGLETSCAVNNMIWFYNLHVLASASEIANHSSLTFEFNIDGVIHIATTTQSLREVRVNYSDISFNTRALNQIYKITDLPEVLTILPVLFRIICNENETMCPNEWTWHVAAHFSSNLENTVTSIADDIHVTASASCNELLDQTIRIGESVSFSTNGAGCSISIMKLMAPCPIAVNATTEIQDTLAVTDCVCMKGYSRDDAMICQNCVTGKFKDVLGDGPCQNCEAGKFSNSTTQFSVTTCMPCGEYSSSLQGATKCTCNPGAEKRMGNITCTECARGFYKTLSNDATCTSCPSNSVTDNKGATDGNACKCQTELGWMRQSEGGQLVCEQTVEVLNAKFEVDVTISDFSNNVGNVQTDFVIALALAFAVDPINITLVYYQKSSETDNVFSKRRLLQSIMPTTIVEAMINVFRSPQQRTTSEVSAKLLLLIPRIKILELDMTPKDLAPIKPIVPKTKIGFIKPEYFAIGAAVVIVISLIIYLTCVMCRRSESIVASNQVHEQTQFTQTYYMQQPRYTENPHDLHTQQYFPYHNDMH